MDPRHFRAAEAPHLPSERLVERYRAVGVGLTWHPPTRTLFGTRPKPATAEVIDVSVSGALLLADLRPRVAVGSVVGVELDGAGGLVEVRHVHHALHPEQRHYGVLFLELDPVLRRRVSELVVAKRGDLDLYEQRWRTAR